MSAPMMPKPISDIDLVFPTSVSELMPAQSEIPEDFKDYPGNAWVRLTSRWFYQSLPSSEFIPVDGVDKAAALRHIKAILGSWEPKHEHKTSAVAYLMSLWFSKVRVDGTQVAP